MFRDVSLPHDIAFGASSGPEFATDVFTSPSGWEGRRGHWLLNRGRWEMSFINKTYPEMAPLLAFFRAVAVGRAYSFRFRDFTDYQFNNQIGWGDSTTRDFRLIKIYRVGAATFTRFLTKPDMPTIRATINGVSTSAFSVDGVTGVLYFDDPPPSGAVVIASGDFDCMVRFDQDTLELTAVDPGPSGVGVFSIENLVLVEVINEEVEPSFVWRAVFREPFEYVTTWIPWSGGSREPMHEDWTPPLATFGAPHTTNWDAHIADGFYGGHTVNTLGGIVNYPALQMIRQGHGTTTPMYVIPKHPNTSTVGWLSTGGTPTSVDMECILQVPIPLTIDNDATGEHWTGMTWGATSGQSGSANNVWYLFFECPVNEGTAAHWRYGYMVSSGITKAQFVTVEEGDLTFTQDHSHIIGMRAVVRRDANDDLQICEWWLYFGGWVESGGLTGVPLMIHQRTRLGDRQWLGNQGSALVEWMSITEPLSNLHLLYDDNAVVGYEATPSGSFHTDWYASTGGGPTGGVTATYVLQDQWTPLVGQSSLLLRMNFLGSTTTPQSFFLGRRSHHAHPEDGRIRAVYQVRASVGTELAYWGVYALGRGTGTFLPMNWPAVGLLVEFNQVTNAYTRVLLVRWTSTATAFLVLAETPFVAPLTRIVGMELEWHRDPDLPNLILIGRLGSTTGYSDLVPVLSIDMANPYPFPSRHEGPIAFFNYDGGATTALDVSLDNVECDELIQLAL